MSKIIKGNYNIYLDGGDGWEQPPISNIDDLCPADSPTKVGDYDETNNSNIVLDYFISQKSSGDGIYLLMCGSGTEKYPFLDYEINTNDPVSNMQIMTPGYAFIVKSESDHTITDLLYDCILHFVKNTLSSTSSVHTSYDGRKVLCEDFVESTRLVSGKEYTTDFTVNIKYSNGRIDTFYMNANTKSYSYPYAMSGNVEIELICSKLDASIKTFSKNIADDEALCAPEITEGIDEKGLYLLIKNKYFPTRGYIYQNGSPEPYRTYKSDLGVYKFYPTTVGAYTANEIVSINGVTTYSELSETYILSVKNDTISLSFNEYTGILTATTQYNSVYLYKLYKQVDKEFVFVSDFTDTIAITEAGTYKVEGKSSQFFNVTQPAPISIETTLDSPTLYIDYSNPSQLGFDEVDNATEYDVYKMNENGEFELYETIKSENNVAMLRSISVNRKLKIFNVVTK